MAAAVQRSATMPRRTACARPARSSGERSPATASAAPKVHTMVAPVGRSKAKERPSPAALASVPVVQPIASCRAGDEA